MAYRKKRSSKRRVSRRKHSRRRGAVRGLKIGYRM